MRQSKWLVGVLIFALIFFSGADDSGPFGETQNEPQRLVVQAADMVSQLTGPGSPSRTEERWNISGTDLGISFEHDDKIFMVFGDTWGRDGVEGSDWRSNTMGIVEPDPTHGFVLTDVVKGPNGNAKELLPSLKEPGEEYTVIPTAAISVDDRIYMHYESVRNWERHPSDYKHPIVNGSGLAYSDDDGQTWTKAEDAVWPGDTAFTQAAFVKHDGHVYLFGTPAGRFGAAKLLRVDEDNVLEPEEYEYWNGEDWVEEANQAAEVVPAPVGELSVRWNPRYERWMMMYRNEMNGAIVLRTAQELTGPWSEERTVVTSATYPTIYGPFMLPITGEDVYFTVSIFKPDYQVYVMRMPLQTVEPTAVRETPAERYTQ